MIPIAHLRKINSVQLMRHQFLRTKVIDARQDVERTQVVLQSALEDVQNRIHKREEERHRWSQSLGQGARSVQECLRSLERIAQADAAIQSARELAKERDLAHEATMSRLQGLQNAQVKQSQLCDQWADRLKFALTDADAAMEDAQEEEVCNFGTRKSRRGGISDGSGV